MCTVIAEFESCFIEHVIYTQENKDGFYAFSHTASVLEVSVNKPSHCKMGTGEPTNTRQILLLLVWQSVPERLFKAERLFGWKILTILHFSEQRAAILRSV